MTEGSSYAKTIGHFGAPREWTTKPDHQDVEGWLERGRSFAHFLSEHRADLEDLRDRINLLKSSGLVTLLGPHRHGGGGQQWSTAHRILRTIGAIDSDFARALAHHYVWVWLAEFIGTAEKIDHIGKVAIRGTWFFGGAETPNQSTLRITDVGQDMIFNGVISPTVGNNISDITILEGRLDRTNQRISALAMSTATGLRFVDVNDSAAEVSESAEAVTVSDVSIPWTGALGHVDKRFQPRTYNRFLEPTLDLALVNVRLGALRGQLDSLVVDSEGTDRFIADSPDAAALGSAVSALWATDALADLVASDADILHSERAVVTQADYDDYISRVASVSVQSELCLRHATEELAPRVRTSAYHPRTDEWLQARRLLIGRRFSAGESSQTSATTSVLENF